MSLTRRHIFASLAAVAFAGTAQAGFYVRHTRQRRWIHGEWVMRRGAWVWVPAHWD